MTANIPDRAVEAAAEAIYKYEEWSVDFKGVPYDNNPAWDTIGRHGQDRYRAEARAVLSAALPILREELAKQIEWVPSSEAPDDYFRGYRGGMADAARIVRGDA